MEQGLWAHAHLLAEPSGREKMWLSSGGTEVEISPKVQTLQGPGPPRWLLQAYLPLKPGQDYVLEIRSGSQLQARLPFRSLPRPGQPLRFVEGGDTFVETRASELFRVAALQQPDFAVLGGDLAYDNGDPKNWQLVDRWLTLWCQQMKGIPMLPVIGNHEVQGGWGGRPEDATFYLPYFNRNQARTYGYRELGGYCGFWNLDSGHCAPPNGEQARWLQASLREHPMPLRMASYHVPMYPSHRPYQAKESSSLRQAWLPLFDRHRLQVAFEHHDHTFKRTHPLRAGQRHPKGTLYLGDGCWGQETRAIAQDRRAYLARALPRAHFWKVLITAQGWQAEAVDQAGDVFDRCQGTSGIP